MLFRSGRFAAWGRFGPLEVKGETLALGPGGEGIGLGSGFHAPAMVPMPEVEVPMVERAQFSQEPEERHGVLAAGEGH